MGCPISTFTSVCPKLNPLLFSIHPLLLLLCLPQWLVVHPPRYLAGSWKPTLTSSNSPSLPSWASPWRLFCGDSALFTTLISIVCFQPLHSQPSFPAFLSFLILSRSSGRYPWSWFFTSPNRSPLCLQKIPLQKHMFFSCLKSVRCPIKAQTP